MKRRTDNNEKGFFTGNTELPGLVASLDKIFKKINQEGLGKDTVQELDRDIQIVTERFSISPRAAVLLPAILENNFKNGCDDDDLSRYVGCSNIEFIGFRGALREMEDLSIINRRCGRSNRYVMCREAVKAVERDTDFIPACRTGLSADELFSRFRIIFGDFHRNNIDTDRLLEDLMQLIADNPQLEFCRKAAEVLSNPAFCDSEKRFFLALCHRYVSHGNVSFPIEKLLVFSDFMEDGQRIRRGLANESSDIQKAGLVTFGGDEGFQDTDSLALSDEVKRTFFTEVTPAKEATQNHRDLVPCSAIKPRELFYEGTVSEQMERLAMLLNPENFSDVQERLSEMGMRKGFAILFSGGAGCGKTAGAYELARRTGRDVFAVDMSQLKSKWVGDSEKVVKGVFTTYRQLCRTRALAPILLFNEADAIFTKRIQSPGDSVDQMMNAIQNICLDALENLDGVLIATTNLAGNFCDEAFSRRFIFKLEFCTPGPDTRSRIWKSMIPDLTDNEASILGRDYSFSGGNIENIARKSAISYVLSGRKAGLEELISFCEEETLRSSKSTRKIGFSLPH